MKQVSMAIFLTILLVVLSATSSIAQSRTRVRGHWQDTDRDGVKDTYVNPYTRTNPNSSRTDNFSYPGNYNPNKGEMTPYSNSLRETYPRNPNPYERSKSNSLFDD